MNDIYERKIEYIRISVTDRCNLRCVYCMPESGVEFLPHNQILSYEEIIRIVKQMTKVGIRKVKITGGEPLVRKDLPWLIKQIKEIPGIEDVTLTTNGILLKGQVEELVTAGIRAINVSLDTLDREQFQKLCRFDGLNQVLEGIEEALKYPQISVKVNCVPVMGRESANDILRLAKLAKDRQIHVRFIELMPIGLGQEMEGWTQEVLKAVLEREYGTMTPHKKPLGNGPCVYYSLEDFTGKIGFISAVSHKFCNTCNRIRLTSDGVLKTCLQYEGGENLKKMLEEGVDDDALLQTIEKSVRDKPKEHQFGMESAFIQEEEKKKMFRIGG